MSEKKFNEQFENKDFRKKILEAKEGKPLERVECIIEAFEKF